MTYILINVICYIFCQKSSQSRCQCSIGEKVSMSITKNYLNHSILTQEVGRTEA